MAPQRPARMLVAVAMVALFAIGRTVAQICPTPITESIIDNSAGVTLPQSVWGPDIAAAGPYVMALYSTPSGTFSQFSFSFGTNFPEWTKRQIFSVPTSVASVGLVSDGREIFAVGNFSGGLAHKRFSFADFTWKNGSVIYDSNGIPKFMDCAARIGRMICYVADSFVASGSKLLAIDSSTSISAPAPNWIEVQAQDMPVPTAKPGIASDGTSFMICAHGSLNSHSRVVCAYSSDGTLPFVTRQPFSTASDPFPGDVAGIIPVKVSSNKITNTYIVAFPFNGAIYTAITLDLALTWRQGNSVFPGVSQLPSALVFANRFVSMYQQAGVAYIAFQNSTTPLQWTTQTQLVSSTAVSLTTAGFAQNFYYAFKDATKGVVVHACIPTSAPTFAPSPSPTGAAAPGQSIVIGVQMLLLLTAVLLAVF